MQYIDENGEERDSVADALNKIALWVKYLGGGDNADQRGAVEVLGSQCREGAEEIAGAIRDHAQSVRELAECVHGLAEAVKGSAGKVGLDGMRELAERIGEVATMANGSVKNANKNT